VADQVRAPLLPLHIVRERNRGGSVIVMALTTIGLFGAFLFLTFFLQNILGYSPIKAGLAFLPLSAGIIIGSTRSPPGCSPSWPRASSWSPGCC